MNEEIESELKDMIDGKAASFDDAVEAFNDALTTVEEGLLEDFDQEEKERRALQFIRASEIEADRTTYGESMDLQVLAIGGRQMQWSDGDGGKKDVVLGYGLIHPPGRRLPAEEGDNGPEVGLAVFILDSEKGVDPADAMQSFSALNTITGRFSVSRSNDISSITSEGTVETDLYRCEATTKTVLNDADPDEMDLPTDRDAKNQVLRSRIPEATLADAATDIATVISSYDPETGYAHEFGGDLRRINASIVDYYKSDDGSWGRYTVMDDSVLEDELEGTAVMGEDQQTPGLTAWADPKYHINYGRKSQVDLYCYIETNDDGQIQANVVGVVPILPMPLEGDDGAQADVNSTESTI